MSESLGSPVMQRSTSCSLGSRKFQLCLNVYSNRLFVSISELGGDLGTLFSVRKDSPLPDPVFGTTEEIYTVKTLFGAESIELLLAARVLGQAIGQFTDNPQILSLALVSSSKQTLTFLSEQLQPLFNQENCPPASSSQN